MSDDKKVCVPFEHPNLMPGWGCCHCRATGSGTFNGNNRAECKTCGHRRCDNTPVKRIPVREEGGVRIVTVNIAGAKDKSN